MSCCWSPQLGEQAGGSTAGDRPGAAAARRASPAIVSYRCAARRQSVLPIAQKHAPQTSATPRRRREARAADRRRQVDAVEQQRAARRRRASSVRRARARKMKHARSSRLYQRQKPERSQLGIFTLSRRRLKKTKRCPESGSCWQHVARQRGEPIEGQMHVRRLPSPRRSAPPAAGSASARRQRPEHLPEPRHVDPPPDAHAPAAGRTISISPPAPPPISPSRHRLVVVA